MKRTFGLIAVISFVVVLLGYSVVFAQADTSFNYLGYLEQNGSPVNNSCDFDFSLFAVETDGTPIADMAPLPAVEVANGVFYVTLDFGDIFTNSERWLETAVRCPTGVGNYVILTPRVPLKYPLEGLLPGVYPDGTGQVGINKDNPTQTLDVNGVVAATGGNSNDWNIAFGWGDHALAGYLTSESDPQVGSLSTSRVPRWNGSYLSNGLITDNNASVGINDTTPSYPLDVNGSIRTTGSIYKSQSNDTIFWVTSASGGGGYLETEGPGGSDNIRLSSLSGFNDNGYLAVIDSSGLTQAGIYVNSAGDGIVFGDTKNFRMENPNQPGTEIWYASLEGPEAAAYIRGTAQLINGRATIQLPDHFRAVASLDGLTVQLTPLSADSRGLAVVSKSLEGIRVQELNNGTGSYEFDFFVMAIRQGYEDYEVIRHGPETERANPAAEGRDGGE